MMADHCNRHNSCPGPHGLPNRALLFVYGSRYEARVSRLQTPHYLADVDLDRRIPTTEQRLHSLVW